MAEKEETQQQHIHPGILELMIQKVSPRILGFVAAIWVVIHVLAGALADLGIQLSGPINRYWSAQAEMVEARADAMKACAARNESCPLLVEGATTQIDLSGIESQIAKLSVQMGTLQMTVEGINGRTLALEAHSHPPNSGVPDHPELYKKN